MSDLVNIEHLEDAVTRLMNIQSQKADDDLATIIPQIWLRAGDILTFHWLVVGKYTTFYCQRKLWTRSGYHSFKEAWRAEGIPDVSYAAVKGWQYAYQCQLLAGMDDQTAAVQPIGKLIAAKPILQRALASGADTDRMIEDLGNAEVSQQMWLDRRSNHGGEPTTKDRATVDSSDGRITYWVNEGDRGLGIPMGVASTTGDAEWAWTKVLSGKTKMDWV